MGGIPQGCTLSIMFVVDLYLPWCKYLHELPGVTPSCMLTTFSVSVCEYVYRGAEGYGGLVGLGRW